MPASGHSRLALAERPVFGSAGGPGPDVNGAVTSLNKRSDAYLVECSGFARGLSQGTAMLGGHGGEGRNGTRRERIGWGE